MNEVTRLLTELDGGNAEAADQLLPHVYEELRNLAAGRMAQESPGHTLNATALVHEAYLRLVGNQHFENRGHFFAAASEAMRRILVDHARHRNASKRKGGEKVALDPESLPARVADSNILAVDEALARLALVEAKVARLVELRYFGGLTIPEAAATLGVSPRTADSWWAYARAWLAADIENI